MTGYDMCIWCETDGDNTEEVEHHLGPHADHPEADGINATDYECAKCGAIFRIGEKTITFNEFVKEGKPEMRV